MCRLPTEVLALPGLHNQANFLAACALLDDLELADDALESTARNLQALPHRCAFVRELRGVRYYNDSKATNVGATIAAVNGIAPTLSAAGRIVLLAGGDGKGQDFGPLADAARGRLRAVVLIGRDGARIGAALAGLAPSLTAADMTEAVRFARDAAQPGDSVLLSPACASFDMFRDYVQRGERFSLAVREELGK